MSLWGIDFFEIATRVAHKHVSHFGAEVGHAYGILANMGGGDATAHDGLQSAGGIRSSGLDAELFAGGNLVDVSVAGEILRSSKRLLQHLADGGLLNRAVKNHEPSVVRNVNSGCGYHRVANKGSFCRKTRRHWQ